MQSEYVVLDMFAGAGGLAEGFLRNGFSFASHIEMNINAAHTLQTRSLFHQLKNHGQLNLYNQYLLGDISRVEFLKECRLLGYKDKPVITNEITESSRDRIIQKVKYRLKKIGKRHINVIIGGPPCQAYSIIGRGRDPHGMINDPRNTLYLHYLYFLKKFKPEVFVFENVPGIVSAKKGEIYSDFQKGIESIGYRAEAKTLNALNFGVLQNRKRIIFIGWKAAYKNMGYPDFSSAPSKGCVWDLLEDLPPLEPGQGGDGPQEYATSPSEYLIGSGIRNGDRILTHHSARRHNELDRTIYRRIIEVWNSERRRLKYTELPSELRTHTNLTSFLDRFKVVDGNGVSHAIVAHLSKDGHYFIHPDLRQARSLTVREAARIQSFPDNYKFEGPRKDQFIQVGNAVPPRMAEGIAKEILAMLNSI